MSAATTRSLGKAGKNTPRKLSKNANFKAATTTKQQQEQQELRQQATTMAIKRTRPALQTILLRGLITNTHTHTTTIKEGELLE